MMTSNPGFATLPTTTTDQDGGFATLVSLSGVSAQLGGIFVVLLPLHLLALVSLGPPFIRTPHSNQQSSARTAIVVPRFVP